MTAGILFVTAIVLAVAAAIAWEVRRARIRRRELDAMLQRVRDVRVPPRRYYSSGAAFDRATADLAPTGITEDRCSAADDGAALLVLQLPPTVDDSGHRHHVDHVAPTEHHHDAGAGHCHTVEASYDAGGSTDTSSCFDTGSSVDSGGGYDGGGGGGFD